jgi:hypothetical protein
VPVRLGREVEAVLAARVPVVTTEDTEALRSLAREATPGPWKTQGAAVGVVDGVTVVTAHQSYRDAAYLAAISPEVVLGLLDEIDERRAGHECDRLLLEVNGKLMAERSNLAALATERESERDSLRATLAASRGAGADLIDAYRNAVQACEAAAWAGEGRAGKPRIDAQEAARAALEAALAERDTLRAEVERLKDEAIAERRRLLDAWDAERDLRSVPG